LTCLLLWRWSFFFDNVLWRWSIQHFHSCMRWANCYYVRVVYWYTRMSYVHAQRPQREGCKLQILMHCHTNALVLAPICSCSRLIDTNACQLIWSSPFLFLSFPLSIVPCIFFEPWLINFSGD
jgi:hypothetical protein